MNIKKNLKYQVKKVVCLAITRKNRISETKGQIGNQSTQNQLQRQKLSFLLYYHIHNIQLILLLLLILHIMDISQPLIKITQIIVSLILLTLRKVEVLLWKDKILVSLALLTILMHLKIAYLKDFQKQVSHKVIELEVL